MPFEDPDSTTIHLLEYGEAQTALSLHRELLLKNTAVVKLRIRRLETGTAGYSLVAYCSTNPIGLPKLVQIHGTRSCGIISVIAEPLVILMMEEQLRRKTRDLAIIQAVLEQTERPLSVFITIRALHDPPELITNSKWKQYIDTKNRLQEITGREPAWLHSARRFLIMGTPDNLLEIAYLESVSLLDHNPAPTFMLQP